MEISSRMHGLFAEFGMEAWTQGINMSEPIVGIWKNGAYKIGMPKLFTPAGKMLRDSRKLPPDDGTLYQNKSKKNKQINKSPGEGNLRNKVHVPIRRPQ